MEVESRSHEIDHERDQTCKMFTLAQHADRTKNAMIETYKEYYKIQSFAESLSLSISCNHVLQAYAVLDTLPPLLLTLDDSFKFKFFI